MQEERRTTIRALVVDDSETLRNFMLRTLRSSQYIDVIGTASNGAEAVERVDELLPDVVIMDVEMPIMDGLEATRRIKQAHPSIAVVLVSGSANLLAAGVAAGADGYLSKPFKAESLICQIIEKF